MTFEYQNKTTETIFETFLRYSDEKEKSAQSLGKVLHDLERQQLRLLDIGTGNGEYLKRALTSTQLPRVELTLVEPSEDLIRHLSAMFEKPRIIKVGIEELSLSEQFDVVLASHLFYHLPRQDWSRLLEKMLALVKPEGVLILVLREPDDVHEFKTRFKPLLFDPKFKALVLNDVLAELPKDNSYISDRRIVEAKLEIPTSTNMADAISIIEFFLNKPWNEIPKPVQSDALEFISAKHCVFKQLDGIAVIKHR